MIAELIIVTGQMQADILELVKINIRDCIYPRRGFR
jgi:hypothetical protein